jgi:transcriptional regulator GlxA family with amidase domain
MAFGTSRARVHEITVCEHSSSASAGVTPHHYLIQKRIERAHQKLAQTDLSLAEIAYAVGFSDQGHLARHFRVLLGTTPRESAAGS